VFPARLRRDPSAAPRWLDATFGFDRPAGYSILGRRSIGVREASSAEMSPLEFHGIPCLDLGKASTDDLAPEIGHHPELVSAARIIRTLWSDAIKGGPISSPDTAFLARPFEEKLKLQAGCKCRNRTKGAPQPGLSGASPRTPKRGLATSVFHSGRIGFWPALLFGRGGAVGRAAMAVADWSCALARRPQEMAALKARMMRLHLPDATRWRRSPSRGWGNVPRPIAPASQEAPAARQGTADNQPPTPTAARSFPQAAAAPS
jgi:hypothetical protein